MNPRDPDPTTSLPEILPVRERARVIRNVLRRRLETLLPDSMREAGIDMWLILCYEDDLDPVFRTLIPLDTWCPILQVLVFFDRGPSEGVERINLSMTDTGDLYDRPWKGYREEEQWELLREIIEKRKPERIGINTGSIQWAAGGLTHSLHEKLLRKLPRAYRGRLVSAEEAAVRFLSVLTPEEIDLFDHVVKTAHSLLASCYTREVIEPGVTTTDDLVWNYWQKCADLGLEVSFKPFFYIIRSEKEARRHDPSDKVIRPGDCVRSDVGIRYLRLTTDHQETAYILRDGETDAPAGLKRLMAEGNRLQDVFMSSFREGLTGNELLGTILEKARRDGIPEPKVYSHSLGLFLHEPGPLIGLPWEQERCPGRGDVRLRSGNAFTMELSVTSSVPEWGGERVRFALEEDVVFTREEGCRPVDGRQKRFYLV